MMRATARHMHHPSFSRQSRGQHHTAGAGGGAAEDLAIDWVAISADAKTLPILGADGLGFLGAQQCGDVIGCVKALQFGGRGARAFPVLVGRHPTECADQIKRGGNARNRQRMFRPIGGAAIDVRSDQQGLHGQPQWPTNQALASLASPIKKPPAPAGAGGL
jgi:hypothetical protein